MLLFCLFKIQIGLVLMMCFVRAEDICYRGRMHVFWVFSLFVFFLVYGHSIQHMNMTLGTSFRTRFDSVLVCASWHAIIIQ